MKMWTYNCSACDNETTEPFRKYLSMSMRREFLCADSGRISLNLCQKCKELYDRCRLKPTRSHNLPKAKLSQFKDLLRHDL